MSGIPEEGTARISLGTDNFLSEHTCRAVVELAAETTWRVKAYRMGDDAPPFYIILLNSDSPEQKCLTLDTDAGENENNVMVHPLETPRPKTSQLWTFEDAAVMERLPPIVLARIQSVARPWLSTAIGGDVALPRLYQNIAGVPSDPDSQKWRIDYVSLE